MALGNWLYLTTRPHPGHHVAGKLTAPSVRGPVELGACGFITVCLTSCHSTFGRMGRFPVPFSLLVPAPLGRASEHLTCLLLWLLGTCLREFFNSALSPSMHSAISVQLEELWMGSRLIFSSVRTSAVLHTPLFLKYIFKYF